MSSRRCSSSKPQLTARLKSALFGGESVSGVKSLVAQGAAFDKADEYGKNAVHYLTENVRRRDHVKLLQFFRDHDARRFLRALKATDSNGWTVLHFASRHDNVHVLRFVLPLQEELSWEIDAAGVAGEPSDAVLVTATAASPRSAASSASASASASASLSDDGRTVASTEVHTNEHGTETTILVQFTDGSARRTVRRAVLDVNAQDNEGSTALSRAAGWGCDRCVAKLLEHHADPYIPNRMGYLPFNGALHSAVRYGVWNADDDETRRFKRTLKVLGERFMTLVVDAFKFQKGHAWLVDLVHQDSRDMNGWTLAHHLAKEGEDEVLAALLTRVPAICDQCDNEQRTPLHRAALWSHQTTCRLLLDHGADPAATNIYGITPYEDALREGHYDCVLSVFRAELDKPAVIDAVLEHLGQSHLAELVVAGLSLTTRGTLQTVQHALLTRLDPDSLARVLSHARDPVFDVNRVDELSQMPPLMTVLHRADPVAMQRIAAMLLQHGADANHAMALTGDTPLHVVASLPRDFESNLLVSMLLNAGAKCAYNVAGETPLHVAVRTMQRPHVVHELANAFRDALDKPTRKQDDADQSASDTSPTFVPAGSAQQTVEPGVAPLWLAIKSGNLPAAEILLSHSATLDEKMLQQSPPTVRPGLLRILRKLLPEAATQLEVIMDQSSPVPQLSPFSGSSTASLQRSSSFTSLTPGPSSGSDLPPDFFKAFASRESPLLSSLGRRSSASATELRSQNLPFSPQAKVARSSSLSALHMAGLARAVSDPPVPVPAPASDSSSSSSVGSFRPLSTRIVDDAAEKAWNSLGVPDDDFNSNNGSRRGSATSAHSAMSPLSHSSQPAMSPLLSAISRRAPGSAPLVGVAGGFARTPASAMLPLPAAAFTEPSRFVLTGTAEPAPGSEGSRPHHGVLTIEAAMETMTTLNNAALDGTADQSRLARRLSSSSSVTSDHPPFVAGSADAMRRFSPSQHFEPLTSPVAMTPLSLQRGAEPPSPALSAGSSRSVTSPVSERRGSNELLPGPMQITPPSVPARGVHDRQSPVPPSASVFYPVRCPYGANCMDQSRCNRAHTAEQMYCTICREVGHVAKDDAYHGCAVCELRFQTRHHEHKVTNCPFRTKLWCQSAVKDIECQYSQFNPGMSCNRAHTWYEAYCTFCDSPGHLIHECAHPGIVCHKCQQRGHHAAACELVHQSAKATRGPYDEFWILPTSGVLSRRRERVALPDWYVHHVSRHRSPRVSPHLSATQPPSSTSHYSRSGRHSPYRSYGRSSPHHHFAAQHHHHHQHHPQHHTQRASSPYQAKSPRQPVEQPARQTSRGAHNSTNADQQWPQLQPQGAQLQESPSRSPETAKHRHERRNSSDSKASDTSSAVSSASGNTSSNGGADTSTSNNGNGSSSSGSSSGRRRRRRRRKKDRS